MNESIYTVYADDNFHLYAPEHRTKLGEFATYDAALTFCQQRISDYVASFKTLDELATDYYHWGESLFISPALDGQAFSSSSYLQECINKRKENQ